MLVMPVAPLADVAGIHVFTRRPTKTWMAGTSPAMTDCGFKLPAISANWR